MGKATGKVVNSIFNQLFASKHRLGHASLSHSIDGNFALARKLGRNGFPRGISARFRLPTFTQTRSGRFTQTEQLFSQADSGPDRVHEIR
jgi:hypothetical protein